MKDNILICPECESEVKFGDLKNLHIGFNICPKCNKGTLVPLENYNKKKEQEEKEKYLYCRNCGYTALIENFPFNFPESPDREKYCPNCLSENIINLSNVEFCSNCKEYPAEEKNNWCKACIKDFEQDFELLDQKFNSL